MSWLVSCFFLKQIVRVRLCRWLLYPEVPRILVVKAYKNDFASGFLLPFVFLSSFMVLLKVTLLAFTNKYLQYFLLFPCHFKEIGHCNSCNALNINCKLKELLMCSCTVRMSVEMKTRKSCFYSLWYCTSIMYMKVRPIDELAPARLQKKERMLL